MDGSKKHWTLIMYLLRKLGTVALPNFAEIDHCKTVDLTQGQSLLFVVNL